MTYALAQVASTFIAPALAVAGAAAVSAPIVIHLLSRLRRRTEPWGAMRFVLEAYRRHRTRLRLEQWLLLLVRCLVVLAAGLALAGPVLSGVAAGWAGPAGQARTLHLLIDDSLASQVRSAEGEQRLDQLKQTATQLIDALGPGDTVAVWQLGQPGRAALTPPTADHDLARRIVQDMSPRYSRLDLSGSLEALGRWVAEDPAGQRPVVALLSGWSQGAGPIDEPAPTEVATHLAGATLLTNRPMAGVANVQVAAVAPRRTVVLAEPGAEGRLATVPVTVQVQRFGPESQELTVELRVTARTSAGAAVAEVVRQVNLAAGQAETALSVELALPSLPTGDAAQLVAVEAAITQGGGPLSADDVRLALVEVRQQLTVGVIGASAGEGRVDGLDPQAWVALALEPGPGSQVAVRSLLPSAVAATELAGLDAVLVLRPDLLPVTAWAQLETFVRDGGVAWLFAPPQPDAAALWVRPMLETFALPWQVGLDTATAADGGAWALPSDQPAPEPLRSLGADWAALLRPVRVMRRLPVRAPADQVWLRLQDPGSEADALLTAAPLGQGHVLLTAVAANVDWSNLMTKPLFVPLLHEALRALVAPQSGMVAATAGQAPLLPEPWRGARQLQRLYPADATPATVSMQRTEAGPQPAEPLQLPGLWGPADGDAPLRLAVNVDAPAGDTRTIALDRLRDWLQTLGEWQLLDDADPGTALAAEAHAIDLTWPMLWIALALVLLESLLARWFSHATDPHRPARLAERFRPRLSRKLRLRSARSLTQRNSNAA